MQRLDISQHTTLYRYAHTSLLGGNESPAKRPIRFLRGGGEGALHFGLRVLALDRKINQPVTQVRYTTPYQERQKRTEQQ